MTHSTRSGRDLAYLSLIRRAGTERLGEEGKEAAMLTVLTVVLVGMMIVSGGLGLSSFFVLAR